MNRRHIQLAAALFFHNPRRPACHPERSEGPAFLSPAPSFAPIPFRIRTYAKSARNPFRIRTSKTKDLKAFRIRTYEKTPGGEGGGASPFLVISLNHYILTSFFLLQTR